MTMSTVVTEEENRLLDDEDDNVSVVSSQGKRRQANFTSPMYRQEELLNRGDVADFSCSAYTRHHARAMLRTMPTVSARETLQMSPQ